MKIVIALAGLIVSTAVGAVGLSAVVGHYRYGQYMVTLPSGRILQLKDLGASEAFLDISETEITLRMTLTRGDNVTQSAKVLEAHFDISVPASWSLSSQGLTRRLPTQLPATQN